MDRIIILDKYNKITKVNNKSDLLDFGSKLGSPIFMKMGNNEPLDLIIYHLLELECCVISIINSDIFVYLGNRIDNDRIQYIKELVNYTNYGLTIKYNFSIDSGIVKYESITTNNNNRLDIMDIILK